jgi:hypothetical protein
MHATAGDYIIRGIKGEYYPCKPDIFLETYEPVTEESDLELVGEDGEQRLVKRLPRNVGGKQAPLAEGTAELDDKFPVISDADLVEQMHKHTKPIDPNQFKD